MISKEEELLRFIRLELVELREQGCDTWEFERRADLIASEAGPDLVKRAETFCAALRGLQPSPDFPYHEPDGLDEIRACRPDGPRRIAVGIPSAVLDDRTFGAWLGRAAGCMLGKPVEGWPHQKISDLLEACGVRELTDYFPPPPPKGCGVDVPDRPLSLFRGHIDRAVRDDDLDYTLVGLGILEQHGRAFTPLQAAEFWLRHLPFYSTYTAERMAYRNFVMGIWPPESAIHRNPYREWIGAQIRGDAFGYACPAAPEEAAGLAYRDACISHVRNGIYGEMWVAAMLAAAFAADDVEAVIRIGLSEIPRGCRLAEAVGSVLSWRGEGLSADAALDRIMQRYGRYDPTHVINNAAIVARALLWGERDCSRTLGLAVTAGLDTDCNGATAGSVLGAMLGAARIPEHWTAPLNDRIETAVDGQAGASISGLAARTRRVQAAS